MNTVQLECFLSVAEHLNFSRASEELKISQPAVSHQIHSLEEELGVRLFRRTSKSVSLTPEGFLFLPDAGIILKTVKEAKGRLGDGGQRLLPFDIGCSSQMETQLFPAVLRALAEEIPALRPQLHLVPPESLAGMAENRHLHVSLGFSEIYNRETLVFRKLYTCPVVCICAPDHPLADREAVDFAGLKGSIVSSHTHRLPADVITIHSRVLASVSYQERYFGESMETILPLVKAGLGYTLYPDVPPLRDPSLRYIPVGGLPPADYGLYYRKDCEHPVLRRFVKYMRKMAEGEEKCTV